MATIERNQPCPCGSGTKYKKCCFLCAAPPPPPVVHSAPGAGHAWVLEDDGLDELSNSVVDLVRARRFDEAGAKGPAGAPPRYADRWRRT